MGFSGLVLLGALGLAALSFAAWVLGARRSEAEADAPKGLDTVSGSMFGLFGLLLAFSFSASAARFELRRSISIDEANAIGTAALRLDLLPGEVQPEARKLFRSYLDSRKHYLALASSDGDLQPAWRDVVIRQGALWKLVVGSVPSDRQLPVHSTLLPALNDMFDIATTRHVAIQTHAPAAILLLLAAFTLITAFLGGRLAHRAINARWLGLLYAVFVVATLAVMIDIDYPRRGLIRANMADNLIQDVADSLD